MSLAALKTMRNDVTTPEIWKSPRMGFFSLLFLIDVYDTYLHEYPAAPEPDEIHEVTEKGAFAKYEGRLGRLCWMGLSYGAWFLLLQKNLVKAKRKETLSASEMVSIGLGVGGFLLRVWCKKLLGRHYTYQITVYKDHEVMDEGPYSVIRHPGMAGILINWMGISSWINHPYGWALYALILRDTYYHTLSEEKEFKKNLPAYGEYMKWVPARFIPYIW